MADIPDWIVSYLKHRLGATAHFHVSRRMEIAETSVAAGMRKKGVLPPHASIRTCVRDALFRLWKAVVGSGDLADAIRDDQDDAVLAVVLATLDTDATLAEIVRATREAAVEVTF